MNFVFIIDPFCICRPIADICYQCVNLEIAIVLPVLAANKLLKRFLTKGPITCMPLHMGPQHPSYATVHSIGASDRCNLGLLIDHLFDSVVQSE